MPVFFIMLSFQLKLIVDGGGYPRILMSSAFSYEKLTVKKTVNVVNKYYGKILIMYDVNIILSIMKYVNY